MSDPALGRYHFLAWARRGIGASVANPDNGALPSRASLSVQLSVSAQQGSTTNIVKPSAVPVQLYGPGDVIGIDPRHVIRTEPRNFTVNFEPNYLCGIEFDGPDFPWLFTPAAPVADRLRPWVALIVLKAEEFKRAITAPNPLPVITIQSIRALQNLAESWNWAHVQVSGDTPLSDAMSSSPGAALSRLLCPRRLDPETAYTAFLVPAFEIGRQAGLGQDVSSVATADPAWTAGTTIPLAMPVYYQFEFRTSDAGDFESLVRRLVPRVLDAGVGQRAMDVSQPAPHIASAGPPLGLEGALHSVLTKPTEWADPAKAAFQTDAQTWINQPEAGLDDPANPNPEDPVIAPPIYGRWHAAVQAVDRTAAGWVNDLNLDPRNRAGGGMGSQVVQKERTQLMASAWQQVDGVRKANQVLRQAQLARSALQQLYKQHLQTVVPETLMTLTAPLHARLLASPVTIRATVRSSRVPERMLSGTFRRVTRLRRRLGATPANRAPLLARVNSGELTFVPPPHPPGGLVSIEQVSDQVSPPGSEGGTGPEWLVLVAALLILLLAIVVGLTVGWIAAAAVVVAGVFALAMLRNALNSAPPPQSQPSGDLRISSFTPQAVAEVPARPDFQLTPPPAVAGGTGAGGSGAGGAGAGGSGGSTSTMDSATARDFRTATEELFTYIQSAPVDPPQAPALNLAALKTTLLTRLDPITTVPRRIQSLISLAPRLNWLPVDPLDPIMAAPEFPQPMYAPLRDLSPEYVLPGVEKIPADTVGLLLSNHAFIESYMVGLNHEMARQLLWNDYPTDQRGSCFRQFWDVSGYVPQPGDPTNPAQLAELLKDIPPIHTWRPLASSLGQHPNRTDVPLDNVVLLVRGELFKRYPNAIVYAGKAKLSADGKQRVLDETDERYPIFGGMLPTDITFLGFNLSLEDARGGTDASPEGFFFVFQEQPSEPRFGLEPNDASPIAHWAELAWTNFGGGGAGGGGGGGGPFKLPSQGITARGRMIENNPWRVASQVFSLVLAGTTVPDFLSPGDAPVRVTIPPGGGDPNAPDFTPTDPANHWGVNSAQTAYILFRLPFRVLIHADLMLPPP